MWLQWRGSASGCTHLVDSGMWLHGPTGRVGHTGDGAARPSRGLTRAPARCFRCCSERAPFRSAAARFCRALACARVPLFTDDAVIDAVEARTGARAPHQRGRRPRPRTRGASAPQASRPADRRPNPALRRAEAALHECGEPLPRARRTRHAFEAAHVRGHLGEPLASPAPRLAPPATSRGLDIPIEVFLLLTYQAGRNSYLRAEKTL